MSSPFPQNMNEEEIRRLIAKMMDPVGAAKNPFGDMMAFGQQDTSKLPMFAQPGGGTATAFGQSAIGATSANDDDLFERWRMAQKAKAAPMANLDRSYLSSLPPGKAGLAQMSQSGMSMDQLQQTDPANMGMMKAMKAGVPMGQAMKELPYDLKRGFQGTNMIGTGIAGVAGGMMGKNTNEKALGSLGGTIGAALGTMIPIPVVGQALGGLAGSTIGKFMGGLFGGGEDEEQKKAVKQQKLQSLRGNLDRIAEMYRKGGRNG
jgi:hypothetical protein